MKTFIRWQGNKSRHINKFKEWIPEFSGTYIEPFLGSGALFLYLQPERWIINDLNKDLINIWKTVRDYPNTIIKEFKKFSKKLVLLSRDDKLLLCKKITLNINELSYNTKRAIMYILMLYCAYFPSLLFKNKFYFHWLSTNLSNNKYTFNREKYYNNINKISTFLQNGDIYNKSYEEILQKAKKDDFVFLDPPYIEEHDYRFTYNKDERLDSSFLKNLLKQVKQLDNKNVKWLMTQSDTEEVRKLFKEYRIKTFKVYRTSKKDYVNELLIMNY